MTITTILTMSVLIEAIITYVKTMAVNRQMKWQIIVSVLLSIAISVAYSLDIPAAVGIKGSIPYVGSVMTGILISRGSNYIYDLFKKLTGKQNVEIVGADASEGVEI